MEAEAATAGMSTVTAIIVMLIVGAIAGWLAGVIMKGSGYGLVGDIIMPIINSTSVYADDADEADEGDDKRRGGRGFRAFIC